MHDEPIDEPTHAMSTRIFKLILSRTFRPFLAQILNRHDRSIHPKLRKRGVAVVKKRRTETSFRAEGIEVWNHLSQVGIGGGKAHMLFDPIFQLYEMID
jgi:hypothetical protein